MDILSKGVCKNCHIRERKSRHLKTDADKLCNQCYKLSKFCIVCFNKLHTDGYMCNGCYKLWYRGMLKKCPYCNEEECKSRRGDLIKYCSNYSKYMETTEFNSLLNFIHGECLKNQEKFKQ